MKIIIEEYDGNEYGEYAYLSTELITDDQEISMSFGQGEPEDNTLGRDLNDAYFISKALKLAYEAGKKGESLEIVNVFRNSKCK